MIDITGERFGRLVARKFLEKRGKSTYYWECECDCGVIIQTSKSNLTSGHTKSCGCLRDSLVRANATTHGKSKERIYRIWAGMHYRCSTARGVYKSVSVCSEWSSFETFYCDMGEGYLNHLTKYGEQNTTLDRIDSSNGYSKTNCRWATYKQQARNTSNNRLISFMGKSRILKDWAEELGIPRTTLFNRLKNGWTVHKAFTTPRR